MNRNNIKIVGTLSDMSINRTAVTASLVYDDGLAKKQDVINQELLEKIHQINSRAEGCIGFYLSPDQLPLETEIGNWAIVPGEEDWFVWLYTQDGWQATTITYEHPQIDLNGYVTIEELNRRLNIVIQNYTDEIGSLGFLDYVTHSLLSDRLDGYYLKNDLYNKQEIDEKLSVIQANQSNTSGSGGNSCNCPKHIILEQGQYDENNYEEGAIYFILAPKETSNWTFGDTFPITFGNKWTFGELFPITLGGGWQLGDGFPIILT